MKKLFLVLIAGATLISCKDSDKKTEENPVAVTSTDATPSSDVQQTSVSTQTQPVVENTTVEWLDGSEKDFGKMTEGETLDVSFRFKNTGSKPLVITNVSAACGCTVPEQPKEPIAPGATGVIKASFNSTAKVGPNTKQVYMNANTDPVMTTLTFHVEVKPKS